MKIKNGVVSITIRIHDFWEIIFGSMESGNHVGLRIGGKYHFSYHEGLADFSGELTEFSVRYVCSRPDICLVATCLETGRERMIQVEDLEGITQVESQ